MNASEPCVFCGIVAGTVPSLGVAQEETTLAFMDINPVADGHVLVIPRRHSVDLLDTPADVVADAARMGQRVALAAVRAFGANGVNLLTCSGAAAWQSVFHFHLHVIPRYRDRTRDHGLEVPFESVPGDVDAMAEQAGRLAALL